LNSSDGVACGRLCVRESYLAILDFGSSASFASASDLN